MASTFHDELHAQEATHWWHVGKRERVRYLIARFADRDGSGDRALDVGCGTGGWLRVLGQRGWAAGLDHEPRALAYYRQQGLGRLIQHDLARGPWPIRAAAFDLITALDIVEHVEDDAGFVGEMFRVLRPGGLAVVSVPSFQWLWSYWDEWLGHKRRYTRRQVTGLMQQAGFRIVWASYAECATLLAIAPLRWWKQRQVRRGRSVSSDNAPPPAWINAALLGYERFENWLLQWTPLPWGTSVAVVGVKEPSTS